jgi:transcriptional regulator with XRE-family HTH domain
VPTSLTDERSAARASLRELRQRRGLSRAALSRRLHISPSLLYQWETGSVQPHPRHRAALAVALGVQRQAIDISVAGARPAKGDTLLAPGIRLHRKLIGMTVPQLAAIAAVHPATVTKWESGRRGVPRSLLPVVARALDTPVEALTTIARAQEHRLPASAPSLKSYRLGARLTRRQVAEATGLPPRVLRGLEEGRGMTLGRLRLLASVYGVPVSRLAACAGASAPTVLGRRPWCRCDLPSLITALRDWGDLSAKGLAARCQVSPSTVSRWERGLVHPSSRSLRRLEQAFGLPTGTLPRGHRSATAVGPWGIRCCAPTR